jgi:hypothetical protein
MRCLATAVETCHIVADKLFSHMPDFVLKVLNLGEQVLYLYFSRNTKHIIFLDSI